MSLSNYKVTSTKKKESIIIIKKSIVGKKEGILVQPLMEMVHLVPRGSAVVLAPWSFQANYPTAPRVLFRCGGAQKERAAMAAMAAAP